MCGIFAAVTIKETFTHRQFNDFCASCEQVAHRGPDNQTCKGYLRGENGWQENDGLFRVFLGHRRLAILGLETASDQPFSRDHLTMVYNGEVFNYLEIKRDYLSEYEFETGSDTEVILRAYQKFGPDCFRLFNGMWTILILDRRNDELIVCRDRFSVKPLYLMRENHTWYFASEVKQLTRLPGFKAKPDMNVLKAFLNQSLLDHTPDTFYEGIRRFPAMQFMRINLHTGQHETRPYWQFSHPKDLDFSQPEETFRRLLLDSLKLRLRSDVPIGTLLSGGLDSSAITVLIREHLHDMVTSFSVVSDEKKYSEEPFVDILVREKGISNQKLRLGHKPALEHIDRVLDVQDEPYGSLSVVAQYLLFQKIKDETGTKVLLSGQGADEVLLGYNKFYFFHLKQLWRQKKWGELADNLGGSFFRKTMLWQLDLTQAKRYMPKHTNQGRKFYRSSFENEPLWLCSDLAQRQIIDIEKYSVPALTHYEDRNSMAASIEVRLPFMDFRLVDFLVNLPASHKLKHGWTKHLLRKSIHELPAPIRWRKDKKGFVIPEEEWMKGELGSFILSEMGEASRLEEMGILDKKLYIKAVEDFRKGNRWLSYGDLSMVYITEKWLRKTMG